MNRDLHDKVIAALEKTSLSAGFPLEVKIYKPNDIWILRFTSGSASVETALSTFVVAPRIVLDPFVEEIIKRNL